MTDQASQQIDDMVSVLKRYTDGIGAYGAASAAKANAEKTLASDLKRSSSKASEAIGAMTGSAASAHSYFTKLIGGGLIGGAFAKLIHVGKELTGTYRQMANQGATFNGSLLEMSIAAASAGMPLEDFADAVKGSSKIVAQMGMKDFVNLSKSVNKSMMQYGMFGMTQGQITKGMGDYMETQRLLGMTSRSNVDKTGKSFVDLVDVTTGLTGATGVARDAIMDLAQETIRSSMASSRFAMMSDAQAKSSGDKFQKSMLILSAQAGEAGRFLASLHANAFGQGEGMGAFSDQGKELISVGMGNIVSMFDHAMSPEETINAQEAFRKQLTANVPLLRDLAKGTGESASNAKQLLNVQRDMVPLTIEELRRKQKEGESQKGLTKIFTTFGTYWNIMTGQFRSGFLKGFMPLFDAVGDFTKSSKFKKFSDTVESLGKSIGIGLGNLFTSLLNFDSKSIGSGIKNFADSFANLNWKEIGAGIAVVGGGIAALKGVKWGLLAAGLGGVAALLAKFNWILTPVIQKMVEWPKVTGGVILGFWALTKFLKGKALLDGFRGGNKVINAKTVIVNGAMGGGGGGGADPLDLVDELKGSKGSFKRGAFSKMGRRFKAGKRAGGLFKGVAAMFGKGGRGMAKAGEKGLFKGLWKKIPGISILAGLGFGGSRLLGGDMLGAGGEVLSGILGSLPGLGTAGSIGIDAALAARDMGAFGGAGGAGGANPAKAASKSRFSKMGRMAMMAGGAGAVGLGGAALYDALSGDDTPADPANASTDTLVDLVKETNKKLDSLNDTLAVGQRSIASRLDEQKRSLQEVIRRPAV